MEKQLYRSLRTRIREAILDGHTEIRYDYDVAIDLRNIEQRLFFEFMQQYSVVLTFGTSIYIDSCSCEDERFTLYLADMMESTYADGDNHVRIPSLSEVNMNSHTYWSSIMFAISEVESSLSIKCRLSSESYGLYVYFSSKGCCCIA